MQQSGRIGDVQINVHPAKGEAQVRTFNLVDGGDLKSGTSRAWPFSLRTRELAVCGLHRNLTLRGGDAITTDFDAEVFDHC